MTTGNFGKSLKKICPVILAGVFSASVYGESELHGSVSITSDYFWRGYSKSDGQLSGQINLDLSTISDGSGYYVGGWISSVDFGQRATLTDTDTELVVYGGWSQPVGDDFTIDLQLSHYIFNNELFGEDADYSEVYLFLHFRDLITAELAFSPDTYSTGKSSTNGQLTFRYPIHEYYDFSAGVGYFAARDVLHYNYRYWNAGFTWIISRASADLRYFGARETDYKVTFPAYPQYRLRRLPFEESATVFTISIGF